MGCVYECSTWFSLNAIDYRRTCLCGTVHSPPRFHYGFLFLHLLVLLTFFSILVASLAPNSTLLGSDAKDAAVVDQWVALVDSQVVQHSEFVIGLVTGTIVPYSKPVGSSLSQSI